jgi:hypothetical protein
MKPAAPSICGFLATLACSPAFAEPQALITVDPNNFAAGQNISKATTGAQLLAMTYVPNPDPNFPDTFIVQNRPAVYAQPVAAGCTFFGGPCAASGNLAIGYSPTTIPSAQAIFWGDAFKARQCVEGSLGPEPQICDNPGGLALPVLRVNFSVPTDKAAALVAFGLDDASEIDGFQAFDSSGNLLATCFGNLQLVASPPGCMTVVSRACASANCGGWAMFTISRPSADINFVLVGGQGNDRPISQVQFDSPVSLQFSGLLTKVSGVGPGKSLFNQVMIAQAYYAVADIQATCATLAGFMSEMNAQNGKKIGTLTAFQLLGTARAIETALNCH